jgi:aldehyde dehydrogenase (NAD+)
MEDEIFGPILPILTYTDFNDALARIAAKPAPLAAFIFSTRQDHIDRFIGSLSYGGGAVNQVNIHFSSRACRSAVSGRRAWATITADTALKR